jgi:restriction endonuclease S subunit
LGQIEVSLSKIATIQVGYQARGGIEESHDGEFTIIRPQDFNNDGKLILDQAMHFFPTHNIDPQNYFISTGDILVQARGQNHMAYLIDEELENTVASNSFYIVQIKEDANVLPAYLVWWINQSKVQNFFEQEQGLSTIPFISKSGLSKAPVIVPPLNIQQQIGELIMLWGKEQELSQRLTQKKEALIHAMALKAIEKL